MEPAGHGGIQITGNRISRMQDWILETYCRACDLECQEALADPWVCGDLRKHLMGLLDPQPFKKYPG